LWASCWTATIVKVYLFFFNKAKLAILFFFNIKEGNIKGNIIVW